MTPASLLTGDEIAARLIGLDWTLEAARRSCGI